MMIPSNFQGDEPGVHDRAKGDVDHVRPGRPRQHRDGGHPSPAWPQVVQHQHGIGYYEVKFIKIMVTVNEIISVIIIIITLNMNIDVIDMSEIIIEMINLIILSHGGGSNHGHSHDVEKGVKPEKHS